MISDVLKLSMVQFNIIEIIFRIKSVVSGLRNIHNFNTNYMYTNERCGLAVLNRNNCSRFRSKPHLDHDNSRRRFKFESVWFYSFRQHFNTLKMQSSFKQLFKFQDRVTRVLISIQCTLCTSNVCKAIRHLQINGRR